MVSFGFNSETGGQFYSLIFPFTNIILWYKSQGKKYFFILYKDLQCKELIQFDLFYSIQYYQFHFDANNCIDNDCFIN